MVIYKAYTIKLCSTAVCQKCVTQLSIRVALFSQIASCSCSRISLFQISVACSYLSCWKIWRNEFSAFWSRRCSGSCNVLMIIGRGRYLRKIESFKWIAASVGLPCEWPEASIDALFSLISGLFYSMTFMSF